LTKEAYNEPTRCSHHRRDRAGGRGAFGAGVVEKAFAHVGRSLVWQGKGVEECGIDKATGDVPVEIDPSYFSPTEVECLLGDASKARAKLGWRHHSFNELLKEMVDTDVTQMQSRPVQRMGTAE
jgi:GDP-D-mannose dehydratase